MFNCFKAQPSTSFKLLHLFFSDLDWFLQKVNKIFIKCSQLPNKKLQLHGVKPSTFWGKWVKWERESLKLPTALNYQTTFFYIPAVYFKNLMRILWKCKSQIGCSPGFLTQAVGQPVCPCKRWTTIWSLEQNDMEQGIEVFTMVLVGFLEECSLFCMVHWSFQPSFCQKFPQE